LSEYVQQQWPWEAGFTSQAGYEAVFAVTVQSPKHFTDRISEGGNAVASIRLFVSTVFSELTDDWNFCM